MIIHSPISSFPHIPQTSSEVLPLIFVNRSSSAPMSRKLRPEMKPFTWSLWTASTTSSAPSSLYWQQFYQSSQLSFFSDCNLSIDQKSSGRVIIRSLQYSSLRCFSPPLARFLRKLRSRKFSLQRQHTLQYSWFFSATPQTYIWPRTTKRLKIVHNFLYFRFFNEHTYRDARISIHVQVLMLWFENLESLDG